MYRTTPGSLPGFFITSGLVPSGRLFFPLTASCPLQEHRLYPARHAIAGSRPRPLTYRKRPGLQLSWQTAVGYPHQIVRPIRSPHLHISTFPRFPLHSSGPNSRARHCSASCRLVKFRQANACAWRDREARVSGCCVNCSSTAINWSFTAASLSGCCNK